MPSLSLTRMAKLAMVGGALVATVAMAFTLRAIRVQAEDERWVAHTLEARQKIATLFSTVRGVGTGIRVYRMTHSVVHLDAYHAASDAIPGQVAELAALTSDNAVQRRNLTRMRALIDTRLARISESLEGPEPTVEWLETSNQLVAEISGVASQMDAEEASLLTLRRGAAETNERYAEIVSFVGLLSAVGLVILGWSLQRRDLNRETLMMRLLHLGSQVSNERQDPREAVQTCLDRMCEETGWAAAHAHVLEAKQMVSSGMWHLPTGRDFGALRRMFAELRVDPGVGLVGQVMQTRQPTWVVDLAADETPSGHGGARNEVASAGFRGLLVLPVLAGDGVPAILEFFTEKPAVPDLALLEVLTSLGAQLGRVFEREQAQIFQREQAQKIEALATTDELTGLLNRRGFVTMSKQQLRVCRRKAERSLLFFMDMDGLKKINDQLGHAAGDAAIMEIAVVLRCSFREADLVSRLGGDEFVAMAQADEDIEGTLVERIKTSLSGRFVNEDPRFPLAISIGARWVEPDGELSVEELLVEADRMMYEAKRARRTA